MNDKNVKYYDDDINTPLLKTIKAIVPYLDYKYQKQFGIVIKFIEIQMLLEMYEKKSDQKTESDFESAIANAMKIYINNDDIKIFRQALQIKNMFDSKNNINNIKGDGMQEILKDDVFKNLSDNNIELLKNFVHDISEKSPIEAVGILMEYNKKMPKDITKQQKEAIIQALLKKLPPQQQQQFLTLYNMLNKK